MRPTATGPASNDKELASGLHNRLLRFCMQTLALGRCVVAYYSTYT